MNLKVIEIQKILGIEENGILDEFTQAGWMNYCLKNGLEFSLPKQDDVINPVETDESEGLISTDLQERIIPKINRVKMKPTMKIPKIIKGKSVLVDAPNYFNGPTKKEYIFLHFTAGWENPYKVVADWETDQRGAVATQFVVGGRNSQTLSDKYDGEIVQALDYGNYGWHLGIGNVPVHTNSIGIELCLFGPLTRAGNDYLNWVGRKVHPSEVCTLKKDFRGYKHFHKISDEQLHSLNFLIAKIAQDTGIDPREGLKQRLKKMDPFKAFDYDPEIKAGKYKGLFCHTNVSGPNKYGGFDKWDFFPQPELCDLINSL